MNSLSTPPRFQGACHSFAPVLRGTHRCPPTRGFDLIEVGVDRGVRPGQRLPGDRCGQSSCAYDLTSLEALYNVAVWLARDAADAQALGASDRPSSALHHRLAAFRNKITAWTVNYYVGKRSLTSHHRASWCLPRRLRIRRDVSRSATTIRRSVARSHERRGEPSSPPAPQQV